MADKQYVEYDNHYAEMEGATISFGWTPIREGMLPMCVLRVDVINSKLRINPEWLAKRQEESKRWKEWKDFERRIGLPDTLRMYNPPGFIDNDEKRWEWLKMIALGRVKVRGFGKVSKQQLWAFLETRDRMGPLKI